MLPSMRRALSTSSSSLLNATVEKLTRSAIRVVDGQLVGKKAVAARALARGETINLYNSPVIAHPTMHTVCLKREVHVAPTFGAECISHACGVQVPNVSMQVVNNGTEVHVKMTKDVAEGQDLFFNYNTTEWTMSCPFDCLCPHCSGGKGSRRVQGFSKLTLAQQIELLPHASPYVQSLFEQQQQQQQEQRAPQQQQQENDSVSPK